MKIEDVKWGESILFHRRYGSRNRSGQGYCHTCGEVHFEDDLKEAPEQAGFVEPVLLCEKCYTKVPDYIPNEQKRRWRDGVRKKNIQSDGAKRE